MVGQKMETPRDFTALSELIKKRTDKTLSLSTLKRFWGYVSTDDDYSPSAFTANALSQFVGYRNYEDFAKRGRETQSSWTFAKHQNVAELKVGQRLELRWNPNRRLKVKYLGNQRFVIEESENSKLSVGDRFDCYTFVEGNMVLLENVLHLGVTYPSYYAGKNDGITFDLLID